MKFNDERFSRDFPKFDKPISAKFLFLNKKIGITLLLISIV